jgi:hypothetical protein
MTNDTDFDIVDIESMVYEIRGQRVMLDRDLSMLYGVEVRSLNQAVKRNRDRFPSDFMFQLEDKEVAILKSQNVISSWGGSRHNPYAFTEQGVAMLSSVLNSKRAISVNISIMRAFVKIRQYALVHNDLPNQVEELRRILLLEIDRSNTKSVRTYLSVEKRTTCIILSPSLHHAVRRDGEKG